MDDVKNEEARKFGLRSIGRLGFVIAGLGLGALTAYLFSRRAREGRQATSLRRDFPEHIVDDRGTGQESAAHLLRELRDRGFEASDAKLALALGRTTEEIEAFHTGREVIDDDVIMKARGLAMHRGVQIE